MVNMGKREIQERKRNGNRGSIGTEPWRLRPIYATQKVQLAGSCTFFILRKFIAEYWLRPLDHCPKSLHQHLETRRRPGQWQFGDPVAVGHT